MINQIVLDGSELKAILENIVASITAVMLQIMSAVFAEFLIWLDLLILGTFLTNPAPFLVGFLFMLTAWKVHTAGQ